MLGKKYLMLLTLVLVIMGSAALAHDGSFYWTFNDLNPIQGYHEDADPWKGFAFVYVTNITGLAWTDFHFAINNGPGVKILATPAPTMSKPVYTWAIGGGQTTLDYYFASNPVAPGEGVTFTFWTDNTLNQNALFGVCGYPTIPEPSSMLALSGGLVGLVGLIARRRR